MGNELRCTVAIEIKKAIYIKNRIDHREYPAGAKDPIGLNCIIPDDERSHEDILEDIEHNKAMNHPELVDEVFGKWFSVLDDREREVVKLRCKPMGWKKVSRILESIGVVDRQYSDKHLRRIFNGALDRIIARFFND